jgi:hypothetical protein
LHRRLEIVKVFKEERERERQRRMKKLAREKRGTEKQKNIVFGTEELCRSSGQTDCVVA